MSVCVGGVISKRRHKEERVCLDNGGTVESAQNVVLMFKL